MSKPREADDGRILFHLGSDVVRALRRSNLERVAALTRSRNMRQWLSWPERKWVRWNTLSSYCYLCAVGRPEKRVRIDYVGLAEDEDSSRRTFVVYQSTVGDADV